MPFLVSISLIEFYLRSNIENRCFHRLTQSTSFDASGQKISERKFQNLSDSPILLFSPDDNERIHHQEYFSISIARHAVSNPRNEKIFRELRIKWKRVFISIFNTATKWGSLIVEECLTQTLKSPTLWEHTKRKYLQRKHCKKLCRTCEKWGIEVDA